MQALQEGNEEEAWRQHELACELLTESGGISSRLEQLYAIEESIGESMRMLATSMPLESANVAGFPALNRALMR